jgi:2,3-bisphosphoglycerate-dependent phosphoglycerate mutase
MAIVSLLHMKPMSLLILMRHGQSMWNAANRFTGWVDVPLTPAGIEEAIEGGRRIAHLPIDEVHVSTLIRAQMTAMLALAQHQGGKVPVVQHPVPEGGLEGLGDNERRMAEWTTVHDEAASNNALPVHVAWQLNERMYGALQGLDKQATRERYGDEQVHVWRRSYDVPPPEGESLELCAARTLPYLDATLVPALDAGRNVFVAAHGNSLRSIIMAIEGLSREEVLGLEVPTGVPLLYERTDGGWTRREA